MSLSYLCRSSTSDNGFDGSVLVEFSNVKAALNLPPSDSRFQPRASIPPLLSLFSGKLGYHAG